MSPLNESLNLETNQQGRPSSLPSRDEEEEEDDRMASSTLTLNEPIQLYRPANSCEQVTELFTRHDWTDEDILVFLAGGDLPTRKEDPQDDIRIQMRNDFYQRRSEIRQLAEQLKTGEARIDEDGRLVPTDPPRPPRANLPPPPPPGRNHQPNPAVMMEPPPFVPNPLLFPAGAPPDLHPPAGDGGGGGAANLTFRRICFAVLAVVTAFVCVILQTLPLLQPSEVVDPTFDQLLHELLHVKFLKHHLRNCPDLNREPPPLPTLNITNIWSYNIWKERLPLMLGFYSEANCDEGVVHIPSRHVLDNNYMYSSPEEARLLGPYRYGMDHIWRIPCYHPQSHSKSHSEISQCYPGWKNLSTPDVATVPETECPNNMSVKSTTDQCFRGVHDDVISKNEIDQAISLGHMMIRMGGDHFDIHYNVSYLHQKVPNVVARLQGLLQVRYHLFNIQPVAFRIHTAGPMDLYGVNLFQAHAATLNQTTYLDWVDQCKRRNELALYSLPWPFRVPPVRDKCHLMADLEADPRFAIHTSVFLTDGAGMDYRGGVTLYVDKHRSNYQPKHKIRRGVTIDGSRGRVIVSSGGIENRRCRLPTRSGLRTVLQIWWDCG